MTTEEPRDWPGYADDDPPEDYDPGEWNCQTCGGDGWVLGDEIERGYDFGWIDPAKTYSCPNCKGSGDAKDQTYW